MNGSNVMKITRALAHTQTSTLTLYKAALIPGSKLQHQPIQNTLRMKGSSYHTTSSIHRIKLSFVWRSHRMSSSPPLQPHPHRLSTLPLDPHPIHFDLNLLHHHHRPSHSTAQHSSTHFAMAKSRHFHSNSNCNLHDRPLGRDAASCSEHAAWTVMHCPVTAECHCPFPSKQPLRRRHCEWTPQSVDSAPCPNQKGVPLPIDR